MPDNTAPAAQNNDNPQPQQSQQGQGGIVAKSKAYVSQRQQQQQGNSPQKQVQSGVEKARTAAQSVQGATSLADALYTKGVLDVDQLRNVKFQAVSNNSSHEEVLLSQQLVSQEQIQKIKAEMYGIGFIDITAVSIPNDTLNKVNKDAAKHNMAVAFEETSSKVKVAMADPLDLQTVKFIESLVGKPIDTYFATREALQEVIDTKYGAQIGTGVVDQALQDIGGGASEARDETGKTELDEDVIGGAPVAKIVNLILDYAITHYASDIHIEPRASKISVRFRINGVLEEKLTLPSKLASSVVTRIKILSNMKIDEHRVPQDNRFQVKDGDVQIDLRVSVMPTIHGEKVVIRLINNNKQQVDIDSLGLRGKAYNDYLEAVKMTQGIILITGPTGSGKTVTLASTLKVLNSPEVNIMTLEDPVEIRVPGVTQVQVNRDVGLTFATGLRAFLRQDPDIIMVGEIRDAETADLAVQAALTGHLVLATLHTNNAAGALPRLLEMGVPAYLLSSTINVVVGQRLVRTIADDSRKPMVADEKVLQMIKEGLSNIIPVQFPDQNGQTQTFDSNTQQVTLYEPVKSPQTGPAGYTGRTGIFEVMPISEQLNKMIVDKAPTNEIHNHAINEGMITMFQDGLLKSLEGTTTLEEVLRVQNT